ncbi:Bug family tripartite tricarboxylate transporter substrate binding protein [Phreatobacter oligotrophus]|jgi:tripartite-type tricarboxylate transporter receptor subunit TctC|uniref:Tripartite-type tricarboxylate transporter receptor subunit TctC n=1 Tax=Phreatobacter oligotrophus TaxID=1122261 RepID=A0A2T4YXD1_9HYPH|nr:tripartite tricarboxylate transporter substrate binding protein [Phreatobacter oligotrophus]PTM50646.1 tripartite-type tricarboxylate transporter receptor subunit TctC [Phreatobacter oligotrophus]
MTTRRSFTWGASALGLTLAAPGILRAQSYPSRPVRMLVGFAPGGPTDIVARQLAQYMTEPLGQSIVIENRGGANGNIAAQEIASAAPDGYNLFYNTSAIAISPALYPRLGYDVKSFVPVGLTATVPMVLEVHPQMPVNTVDEFVAYVKANADKLSYASTGNGSITHLGTALLLGRIGAKVTHVPYRGSAPALVDLAGGRVHFMSDTINSSLPFIKDGRLKPLAVTSKDRLAALPNIPTLTELGLQDVEVGAWQGIVAPAGTPAEIVTKVNAAMMTALRNKDFLARLEEQQTTPLGSTPAEYGAYITAELARWDKVVKENGITMN